MIKFRLIILTLVGGLLSSSIFANENQGPYVGITTGKISFDISGYKKSSNIKGFVLGYEYDDNFSFEIEKLSGNTEITNGSITLDSSLDSTAFYGVLQKPIKDNWFFNIKAGLLKYEQSFSYLGLTLTQFNHRDTNFSYGAGISYKEDKFIGKLGYSVLDANASSITLSLMVKL